MTDYRNKIGKRSSDQQTGGFLDDARNFAEDKVEQGQDFVDEGQEAAGDGVTQITSIADDGIQEVQDRREDVEQGLDDAVDQGEQFIEDKQQQVDNTIDEAEDRADTVVEETQDQVDSTVGDAQNFVEDTQDQLDEATDINFDETVQDLQSEIGDISGGVEDSLGEAGDIAGDIGGEIGDIGGDIGSEIEGSLGEIGDVAGGVGDELGNIGETVGDLAGEGGSVIGDIGGELGDIGSDIGQGFGGAIGDAGDILGEGGDLAGDIAGGSIDFGSNIAGGAANWVGNLSGTALNVATDIGGDIGNALGGVLAADGSNEPTGNWGEPSEAEQYGQAVIMQQSHSDGSTRYFAITKNDNDEVVALAGDGTATRLSSASTFNDLPSFTSISNAKDAVDAAGKGDVGQQPNNDGNADQKQWSEPQQVGTIGQCVIFVQTAGDGSKRFFTMTEGDDGSTVAMRSDGTGVDITSVETYSELPHYPTRAQAESACPSQPESPSEGGEGGGRDDSSQPNNTDSGQSWGELSQVQQTGNCVIMEQNSTDGDVRYFTLTEDGNGNTVAVGPNEEMVSTQSKSSMGELPHYPTQEDAVAACPSSEGRPSEGGSRDGTSGDGQEQEQERQWSEMQEVTQEGNCVITRQTSSDGAERYFTLMADENGNTGAVASDGSLMLISDASSVGELPHYPTQEDAVAACPSNDRSPSEGGQPGEDNSTESEGDSNNTILGVPMHIAATGGLAVAGTIAMALSGGSGNSKNGSRNGNKNVGAPERNVPGSSNNGNRRD